MPWYELFHHPFDRPDSGLRKRRDFSTNATAPPKEPQNRIPPPLPESQSTQMTKDFPNCGHGIIFIFPSMTIPGPAINVETASDNVQAFDFHSIE